MERTNNTAEIDVVIGRFEIEINRLREEAARKERMLETWKRLKAQRQRLSADEKVAA
jgi:hypothetical protein